MDTAPDLIKVAEAAKACSCSFNHIIRSIKKGLLLAEELPCGTKRVTKVVIKKSLIDFFNNYIKNSSTVSRVVPHKHPRARIKNKGYIYLYRPDHHRAFTNGYVAEHILVVERRLRRKIANTEAVHHINGIKDDNRSENLHVFKTNGDHLRVHGKEIALAAKIKRLLNMEHKVKDLSDAERLAIFDSLLK
jgi:HNH endonuclease